MSDENNKPLEIDAHPISPESKKSEMRKRIEKIQGDIKKRHSSLSVEFDEKTFMDKGWGC